MHYHLISTHQSFAKGSHLGCRPDGDGMSFDRSMRATFLSPAIDSHTEGQSWFRLRIAGDRWHAAAAELSVYATDEEFIHVDGRVVRADELSQRDDIALDDKLRALEPLKAVSGPMAAECSLVGTTGRYLWAALRFQGIREPFRLDALYFDFGARAWEQYLPAVYRDAGDEFLPRYLSLLQSVYEDTSAEISHRDRLFDPSTAPAANLETMLGWLGLDRFASCSEARRRELLHEAADLNKRRGTKDSVVRAIELYLEEQAYLLEYDDVQNARGPRRVDAQDLYDIDEYTCILVIVPQHPIPDERLRTATDIAHSMLPAEISLKVVVLSRDFALGDHNYLGMNTRVGTYREPMLDGTSAISFVRLGKRKDNQS